MQFAVQLVGDQPLHLEQVAIGLRRNLRDVHALLDTHSCLRLSPNSDGRAAQCGPAPRTTINPTGGSSRISTASFGASSAGAPRTNSRMSRLMSSGCVVMHPCGRPRIVLQRAVLQQLHRERRRIRIWNDLVVLTVDQQDRHVDPRQVLGEVRLREGLDAVVMGLDAAHHRLPQPIADDAFARHRTRTVVAVERPRSDIEIELRSIGRDRLRGNRRTLRSAVPPGCSPS